MTQRDGAPAAWMRIAFPKPGFFLVDVRVTVHVNGWRAYDGGFLQGFDVRFPVVPGPCAIATRIDAGLVARSRQYDVEARAGHAIEVWLDYSRLWGNFTDTPRLAWVPLP
jgi:hypothetical protein